MKSIIDVLDDPALLGSAIKDKSTFRAWYVALKAVFSLPMDEEELAIYRECTGRNEPATVAFQIVWLIIGRRGAKSLMMSLIAVYKAVFTDWTPYLAAGERAIVLLVAADREQAKILRRYIGGIFASSPMLNQRVISETADSIELTGGVVVEVATCSYKTVRGRSICVALLDESAFWSEGGANPDREVWRAIRASMASFGSEALAVIASSPYAKRGLLYENFKAYFGKDDRINLVWRAGTKTMNPTISDEFLAAEREADPVSFASEYLAQFREGLDSYIQREIVEAAIDVGVIERPRLPGVEYFAFVDPSGGAGQDAMVLGISHREGDIATLDSLRVVTPPFSPAAAVEEFGAVAKAYGVTRLKGDRWGGDFVGESFRRHGLIYEPSAKPKSEIYKDALSLFMSQRVRLLDHPKLISQLCSLERRTATGARESIDHRRGMADDAANAACGALTMAVADDWSSGRAFLELARREMREMELRSRGDTDESDTPKPILREWARGSVEWYVAQAAIARGEAPLLPAQHDEQPSAPRLIVAPPVYYRTAEEEALGFIYKHIRMPGY